MNNDIFYKLRYFNSFFESGNNIFFYNSYWYLFLIWFIVMFFIFSLFHTARHITYVGMSEEDRESAANIEKDGKKVKRGVFSVIQYDKPYFSLLLVRQFGVIFSFLVFCLSVLTLLFLVVSISVAYYRYDFIYDHRVMNYYLLSSENFYGVAWILIAIALSMVCSSLFYHSYIKSYFGDLDKWYNEKAIKSRENSNLRSSKQVDIRYYKFKENDIYDPIKFFDFAKSKNSIFLGLDENDKPIFFDKEKWDETNVQIIGKMGSGKGVLATSSLLQCYLNYDDFIALFDPKNDEWAYSVFKHYVTPGEFYHIDLNRTAPPQLNLFQGATSDEINELLVASFGLGEKGTDADFYKAGDRKVCRRLSQQFSDDEAVTMDILLEKANDITFRRSVGEQGINFFNLLEELGELNSIRAEKGLDLNNIIKNKGVLLITGSLRDEVVVKVQKMVFLRLVQLLEKRDRTKNIRHVDILLDEIKYLISKSTLEAMGTLRDKKANILFTHQSRGDLEINTKEIDGQTARKVIEDSAGLRWIYRTDNYESAKWASDFTAGGLQDIERRNLSVNQSNVEMASKEATIFKQKANYIDISIIQNLPSRCGLIVGDGQLARLAYSSPVIVQKQNKVITYTDKSVKSVVEQSIKATLDSLNKPSHKSKKVAKPRLSFEEFQRINERNVDDAKPIMFDEIAQSSNEIADKNQQIDDFKTL